MKRRAWTLPVLLITGLLGCGKSDDLAGPGNTLGSVVAELSRYPSYAHCSEPAASGTTALTWTAQGMSSSTDGGLTWTVAAAQPPSRIICITMANPRCWPGRLVTACSRSTDGGVTWAPAATQPADLEV